ncbi:MAG: wax ester/triacylglycerol synthase family O-acyltransferase [Bacteroidia bacterium]
MKQLSGLDASFLYLESANTPMHLGGVYLFAPNEPDEPFSYQSFREYVAQRLHLTPVFRRRLVEQPLNIGYPWWVEDQDFALDYHLNYVSAPRPGDWDALMELAARILSRPLDRNRPLWRMVVVDGLDGIEGVPKGSFALISLVHHAAIDGISGAEIMGALFDPTPEPRAIQPPRKPWKGERIPTGPEMIARGTGNALMTPLKLIKFLATNSIIALDTAAEVIKHRLITPPLPFSAPRMHFNARVSAQRIFRGMDVSLEDIKSVKNREGVKVNDVMLAICSGGLRHYLIERNELPSESLAALVPVSIHKPGEAGSGNHITGMPVALGTEIADPMTRLEAIHESANASKVYIRSISASDLMEFVPSQVAALAGRAYTRMHVDDFLEHPPFNLVITNVPGPPEPLYLNGAKLLHTYGMAPLVDGLGLLIVIFSQAGNVSIGAIACRKLMPDLDILMEGMEMAFEELLEA